MSAAPPGWDVDPGSAPEAFGAPGIEPRWTSSAKSGVGTALGSASRVWFTLSHGILDEVYYPRIDQAATRDLGLIVTDGERFFSEEKRHARHALEPLAPGVPAFRLTNVCAEGRYRIEKRVLADPERDVVLQHVRFEPSPGGGPALRLHALLAPHIGNRGRGNTAWLGEYKGLRMLFAERAGTALALASSAPWKAGSAGYVGASDGWQDLERHKRLTWRFPRAADGNVALVGEIDLAASGGDFVLALGFGTTPEEAALRARASLEDGFERALRAYVAAWQGWQEELDDCGSDEEDGAHLFRTSLTVLKCHEAKRIPGALIASLSIPWGFTRGDEDLGGYHVVWPRDLVESAGALVAVGAREDALAVLAYLEATQDEDGHWPQNMWLDGRPYWPGVQMDETAFPILLLDLARREGGLSAERERRFWRMARAAAGYLVRNGPVTAQDRWEEDPGYSPFTLAVEIAALLAAAELAERRDEPELAGSLRETADSWEALIDACTFVRGTELAREHGVDGYYVRIAPPDEAESATPAEGFVPIKNRPPGEDRSPAAEIVSADALALVRFGLRAPDDPRILGTLKVIDALLAAELPTGRVWRRYNEDGYGEHEDGRPFDGTGVGRPWPLLAGERAHFELAAGNLDTARTLARTLEEIAGPPGLLPEQVWDGPDLPERELLRGHATGSAMPLVWAHAEYLKLRRSLKDGRVFDAPPQPAERYLRGRRPPARVLWRFNHRLARWPAGCDLRIEVLASATVRWSADGWRSAHDSPTRPTGLGVHALDLSEAELDGGDALVFTFCWEPDGRWEGRDFRIARTGRALPAS